MKRWFAFLSCGLVAWIVFAESPLDARMARLRSFADGVCAVTNVAFCTEKPGDKVNPLAMWAAMSEVDEKSSDEGFVRVDFVLKPEEGSDIRCRIEVCRPDRWDGRLWGVGNSGQAGVLPRITSYVKGGSAAMTTDLGTWAWVTPQRTRLRWPECVRRDFDWRATHLMCVYGRKLVEMFYGKAPRRVYFEGGSTGGRQAMSEAMRFPEDFDGIVAHLPDNVAIVSEAAIFHLWRMTHDEKGRQLFTVQQMKTVADAAVEYMSSRDPAPYAGQVVADGRWTEADIDGFIALAARKDPALADSGMQARLKSLYMPVYVDGRCVFTGFAPGTNHGFNMQWQSLMRFKRWLNGHGTDISAASPSERAAIGWDRFDGFVRDEGSTYNACSSDLSRFAARGGKLLITTGWEDQTIPPGPVVEYYERVCAAMGGIEKTKRFCRLYCHPGSGHGGGKGRKMTGVPSGNAARGKFVEWCEKGTAPESYDTYWKAEKLVVPAAAYPGLMTRASGGKWQERTQPRSKPAIDPFYLQCDVSPR